MKLKTFALLATTALAAAFVGAAAVGQPTTGSVESHMAMAKVAAGDDNQRLYRALCEQPAAGPNTGARAWTATAATAQRNRKARFQLQTGGCSLPVCGCTPTK
jgi:hypothetical protein